MTHSIVPFKWYRVASKVLVCFICFVCGCTVSFSFLSSLECPSLSSVKVSNHMAANKGNSFVVQNENVRIQLVILIISAPGNLQKRHILRRTWLTFVDQKFIKYFFVVGKKSISEEVNKMLVSEQEHYSDLLLLPEVEEGYDKLTAKVLKSFIWIDENIKFEHVLKVDDDSFVDTRRLLMELKGKQGSALLYWGYFNGRAQVQHRGKWKDTVWNLCDRYVPYARGGGYILSRAVVQYLSKNGPLLTIYQNEDVSVGAWLLPVNLTRLHDIRFDTEWASRGCSNQFIITHPHNETGIQKLFDALSGLGKICQFEFQKRPSYSYDWSVLPSNCCNNIVSPIG